jgi:pimeloyl-ACP methyl ester carboxylesterase
MMPLARQLVRDCHVYVPDQPGFGGSGHPEHVPDIAGLTDALADWMRMTGLLRATLVGNSQSCQIIAQLAVHHPDLVATAVLQGPTAPPGERNWFWAGGSLAPDSTLLADGAGGWRSDWCGERPWRRRS